MLITFDDSYVCSQWFNLQVFYLVSWMKQRSSGNKNFILIRWNFYSVGFKLLSLSSEDAHESVNFEKCEYAALNVNLEVGGSAQWRFASRRILTRDDFSHTLTWEKLSDRWVPILRDEENVFQLGFKLLVVKWPISYLAFLSVYSSISSLHVKKGLFVTSKVAEHFLMTWGTLRKEE